MEVHPPHQPVHGWRDFAVHLVIVTIGLCIALSMEGLVEHVHHLHLVRQARENIRREIELNRQAAQQNLKSLRANEASEADNIASIHGLMEHPKTFHGSIDNSFNINPMNESAWQTAHQTGAFSYMPYDEVQRYTDLYGLQQFITSQTDSTAIRDFDAAAPTRMGYDMAALPAGEYAWLLHENATLAIRMHVQQQLTEQYDKAAAAALTGH